MTSKTYFSKKIIPGKRTGQIKWCQIRIENSSHLRNRSAGIFNYKCSNITYHHLEPRLSLFNRVNKLCDLLICKIVIHSVHFKGIALTSQIHETIKCRGISKFLFFINKCYFKSGILASWKNIRSTIFIFQLRICEYFRHRVTPWHFCQRLVETLNIL